MVSKDPPSPARANTTATRAGMLSRFSRAAATRPTATSGISRPRSFFLGAGRRIKSLWHLVPTTTNKTFTC